jgi:hypothetical protein
MSEIKVNSTGEVKLFDSDNSNYVSIKSPATVGSNQTFVLPDADGSANNALKTDGSGNLGFVDVTTLVTQGIDWQSTLKTSDFAAVSGEGYFVNTSGGAVTATLPSSPSAGAIVAFKDYAPSFATHNLTIARNSSNIQGNANDSKLSTNRASVVMVYIDSTKGWLFVQESNVADLQDATYISASGGTETTSGDYKIHTFTGDGTFTVSSVGNSAGGGAGASYVVVAGGGGAGGDQGSGGGGAGGYREGKNSGDPYSASPLNAPAGLTLSAQAYPIQVGGGGAGGATGTPEDGTSGGTSIFSTITSAGGGGGGLGDSGGGGTGVAGGSGGGGGGRGNDSGGAGNTPPVSPPQGNNGGNSKSQSSPGNDRGGGGGGATSVGLNAQDDTGFAGNGGNGATSSITGSPVTRGGGGGGGSEPAGGAGAGSGGPGGGGAGGQGSGGTNGTANTGGGGGGTGSATSASGSGGSGTVIIRYKYQN